MMYWHVRIYHKSGQYAHTQIKTGDNTHEIDAIQDFYKELTGCRMLLEGMQTSEFNTISLNDAFNMLWSRQELT